MSMHAVITRDPTLTPWVRQEYSVPDGWPFATVGRRIEVLGFVHAARDTWAIWRDDEGYLHQISIGDIRMDPSTVKVEV